MASAAVETFCCMSSKIEPGILNRIHLDSLPYNVVCIISALMGMLGAVYQVLPSPIIPVAQHRRNIGHAQKAIINWLAMADFFAAFGILLRSVFWLWKVQFVHEGWQIIVCAILADGHPKHLYVFTIKAFQFNFHLWIWVRFFYTATYLFTLCYAIDVFLVCKQKVGSQKLYHAFTWTFSLFLTCCGLGTLYLPDFKCHSGPWRVLPNYLLSYIPIIVVMIMNPILYYLSSKNVRILLTGGLGQLTYIEHNLLSMLKEKFFCIVLVFYVCWLPNIINGIILWMWWFELPAQFLVGLWYVMAVINPLQAVLNSLVYKGWENCGSVWKNLRILWICRDSPHSGLLIETSSSDHNNSAEHQTFSTNHLE